MICIFPDPYPDELLYSVCARYKDLMRYPNGTTATRDFFGGGTITAVVDLPNKLDHLVSELPPGHLYTANEFVDNHTMFPLYAPFLSRDRSRLVREEMCRVGENNVFERIGLMSFRLARPAWLRFCPVCAEADRQRYGETYWHRAHQIPGADVCPHHGVFLEASDAPFHNSRNPGEALSAESVLHNPPPRPLDPSDSFHSKLLDIALSVAWLLECGGGGYGSDSLRDCYYNRLLKRGLAYYNGNIRATKLTAQFNEHYPPQILESLGSKIEAGRRNWILRLLQSGLAGVTQHPIRHILLIRFLGCSLEEFFKSSGVSGPFGSSPWPCLNHTAEHFRQLVIKECRVTDNLVRGKTGKPMGTFSCECGFVYNRVGSDNAEEDRYRLDSVQSYGRTWEDALQKVWSDASLSLRTVARQLGVSDLTVVRYAIRLGLPMNAPGTRRVGPKTLERYKNFRRSREDALEFYRREWLSLLEANPNASRRQLMTDSSFLYLWLRKNDNEWLEGYLPPVRKGTRKVELKDWKSIDIELSAAIEATAKRLQELPGRPVRVSLAAIIREVGHKAWLNQRHHKLPLTSTALEDALELDEEFLLRRVRWAEEDYARRGICPARTYFEAHAGTRNKSGKALVVQSAIDTAMERLRRLLIANISFSERLDINSGIFSRKEATERQT